jgi:hypothetical protein
MIISSRGRMMTTNGQVVVIAKMQIGGKVLFVHFLPGSNSVRRSIQSSSIAVVGNGQDRRTYTNTLATSGIACVSVYATLFFKLENNKRPSLMPITIDAKLSSVVARRYPEAKV